MGLVDSLKAMTISAVCALALAPALEASQAAQAYIKPAHIEKHQHKQLDYVALCERISANNEFCFVLLNESQAIHKSEAQKFRKLQKELAKVVQVAQDRMHTQGEALKPYNERVLYSSIALHVLLVNIFENTGLGRVEVKDLLKYGKEIYMAQKEYKGLGFEAEWFSV